VQALRFLQAMQSLENPLGVIVIISNLALELAKDMNAVPIQPQITKP